MSGRSAPVVGSSQLYDGGLAKKKPRRETGRKMNQSGGQSGKTRAETSRNLHNLMHKAGLDRRFPSARAAGRKGLTVLVTECNVW